MARPGLAHEATRAGRAGRSRMSIELGVAAQSSRPVSATSLPRHLGRILSHFCTSVSSSVQWGLNLRVRRSPAAGLGFCPKAFQNLEPRSFSPRTALGGLTTHTPWLTSRQLCPNAPSALLWGHTEGQRPWACPQKLQDAWGDLAPPTAGLRLVQLWQGPWDPWDPSRSVSPQHRAGRKPPRGSRQALAGAGPGRRRSHPLGPCCRPRRPSSPARRRGRPVAVFPPGPRSSHPGSLLEAASGCLSPTLGKPERPLPRA